MEGRDNNTLKVLYDKIGIDVPLHAAECRAMRSYEGARSNRARAEVRHGAELELARNSWGCKLIKKYGMCFGCD